MKKIFAITISFLLAFTFTACAGSSGSANESAAEANAVNEAPPQNESETSSATEETVPAVEEKPDEPELISTDESGFSGLIHDEEEARDVSDDVFEPVPADTSGVLKVWFDNEDHFEALREEFNALYPNIILEFELIGNVDSRAKLQLDGPAGLGPDVFNMPHDHIGMAVRDGLVEDIDPGLEKKLRETLFKTACDTLTFYGAMYAVPILLENIALFYNIDLWGSEDPPETMEEIIEFAASYNNPAENKWAMAWQVDDAYHNFHWLSTFGMQIMGPDNRDYRQPGFDSPEALEGVRYHQSLRQLLFNVPVSDGGQGATVSRFQKGEIPFTITGPWSIATAKRNDINFGIANLPTINGVQPICFSGVIIAAMSSYTNVPDLAYTWLDFLAGPVGATVLYEVAGKLPALADQSQITGLSDDALLQGILKQTPYTIPMPAIAEMSQGWAGLKELFTHTWDGTLTPEEAQAKAMETYKDLLLAADIDINF